MKSIVIIVALLFFGCTRQVLYLRGNQPVTEKNTGILFPSNICGIQKQEMTIYPTDGLGVSFHYQTHDEVKATFYVYNAGLSNIADGVASEAVTTYFKQAKSDVYAMQNMGRYQNVTEVNQKQVDFRVNDTMVTALFVHFNLTIQDQERGSFILMTGYNNQMIKIRYTYPKKLEGLAIETWECILGSFANTPVMQGERTLLIPRVHGGQTTM